MDRNRTVLKSNIAISIYISILYLVIFGCIFPLTLGGDDAQMKSILSGALTGSPDGHILFINYMVTAFLAFLYDIAPFIDWYIVFLVFLNAFSLFAIVFKGLELTTNRANKDKIVVIVSILLVYTFLWNLYINHLGFTFQAAIAGISFMGYRYLPETNKKIDGVVSIILFLLCYCTRNSLIKMMLPFAIAFEVFILIAKKDKTYIKQMVQFWVTVFVLFMCLSVVNKLAYRYGNYAGILEMNHLRASMQDHGGIPAYEVSQELYDNLGITFSEYEVMAFGGWGIIKHFDQTAMGALSRLSEYGRSIENGTFSEKLQSVFEAFLLGFEGYKISFLVFELLVIILSASIVFKNKRYILLYLTIVALSLAELLYLAYGGRVPLRATYPVHVIMLYSVFVILVNISISLEIDFLHSKALTGIGFVFLLLFIWNIFEFSKEIEVYYSDDINKAVAYMDEHSECVWLGSDERPVHAISILFPKQDKWVNCKGWVTCTPAWKNQIEKGYLSVQDAFAYNKNIRIISSPENEVGYVIARFLNDLGYNINAINESVFFGDKEYRIWHFE